MLTWNPELSESMTVEGMDDAILGYESDSLRLIYSVDKILTNLIAQGMTFEEAREWYGYNIEGAYVGERTPIYCHDLY